MITLASNESSDGLSASHGYNVRARLKSTNYSINKIKSKKNENVAF